MTDEHYERPTSCQCATSSPPCSYCTETIICDECGWQGYPDELEENDSIAGIEVPLAYLCPKCAHEFADIER